MTPQQMAMLWLTLLTECVLELTWPERMKADYQEAAT